MQLMTYPYRTIKKRRDPKPNRCLRCGTDDYEPSYRTALCVACRRDLNRDRTRERMRAMRERRRAEAENRVNGDTLINLVGDLPAGDAVAFVDEVISDVLTGRV